MIQQQNLEFLWYYVRYATNWVIQLCKKPHKNEYTDLDFLTCCKNGNLNAVKGIVASRQVDLNQGLSDAVLANQNDIALFLIKNGATNLDDNLKIACINNNFSITEMLVQNGARTVVGLRVAKSPNIIRMLYRYEQNSELIN